MDGTLVDSEPVGPRTFIEIFKNRQVDVSPEDIESFTQSWRRIGDYTPQDELLTFLARKYTINDIVNDFYSLYKNNLQKAHVLSGVNEFLHTAKKQAKKLVVVSASKRTQIESVLLNNQWQDFFDFIVGEEDVSAHKPDPEGYIFAIQKLGLASDEVAIFEDSRNGVLAAKAAGALTVAVKAGASPNQDITEADATIESFQDLLQDDSDNCE